MSSVSQFSNASCDGFVPNVNVLPGQIVDAGAAALPYVCDVDEENRGMVVATLPQGVHPGVKAGAAAEAMPTQVAATSAAA